MTKQEAARAARRERMKSGTRTPGGPAQIGSAEAARESMIERHKEPGSKPEYTTPGEAYETFTREPYYLQDAAQARARMIERMEGRDGDEDGDKARILAKRSPRGDSKKDPLVTAALRDVREAFKVKRSEPNAGQSAARGTRAAMIDRMTGGE